MRVGGGGAYQAQFTHHMYLPVDAEMLDDPNPAPVDAPDTIPAPVDLPLEAPPVDVPVEPEPAPADVPVLVDAVNPQAPVPAPDLAPADDGINVNI